MMRTLACLVLLSWAVACGGKSELFSDETSGSQGGSDGNGGTGGAPASCVDDADCASLDGPCTHGFCRAGACIPTPANEGGPCEDGLFCTEADHCLAGRCMAGPPRVCPGGNECLASACDESTQSCTLVPGNEGGLCDDGHPCTDWGTCTMGICATGALDCSALDGPCQIGVCGPGGCVAQPSPNGTLCNDNNPCTHSDVCVMGTCAGQPGAVVYFLEDFSDNSAGWTLGTEWAIGPAVASMGAQFGNDDPGQDHSPSNDNGIAGVVIGGFPNVSSTHGFFWIESPPFNATIDPGPVVLSFYRWLNSDWEPWMDNRIEVWNGSSWMLVWQSTTMPVTDAAWTFVQHDLTAHKNAAMRVRFGFDVGQFGAFQVSGWNIDDVLVATGACP